MVGRVVLPLSCVIITATAAAAAELVTDAAAKEVRFPFRFVEASQAIEVFGCSPGGPDHEAILTFRATGGEIAGALEKIGARNESFWQVSGRGDFQLTQGDRILVILRWERDGRKREVPAEEILWRTGEDLPELMYGFSYTGRKVKLHGAEKAAIPDSVEITLGGTGRQSAIASILVHPSALDFLAPHVSPLEVNPRYVREIAELAERGRGGTMILRRITERELLEYLLKQEPVFWGAHEILRSQQPHAATIDTLKAEFVSVRTNLNELLTAGDAATKKLVEETLSHAEVLAWRINRAYITLYEHAWRFQEEILQARLKSFQHSWATGYDFLLNFSAERVTLAQLKLQAKRTGSSEAIQLRIRRSTERLSELETLREIPRIQNEIAFLEKRFKEAEERESDYLTELFRNELVKNRIRLKQAELTAERHRLTIQDLDAQLADTEEGRAGIAERLTVIRTILACLAVEAAIADVNERIRWQEAELESQNAERRARAGEKLAELRKKRAELEAELKKRKAER